MLKFKQFILERRRATPQIKAWLGTRAKPYEYWMSRQFTLPFPLSKPMLDRMQNVAKESEGFHITDIDGISTLFDLQNSAKSLSVTTKIKDVNAGNLMLDGVETAGGILVEVKGDALFQGDFDIFSSPDSQGRRWLDIYQFAGQLSKRKEYLANPDLLHNWELIYKKTILEHTKAFIKTNWHELLDFGLDGDHMGYAVRSKEWAAIFWIGGEGFKIKGLGSIFSLAEKGVVDKLERHPDGRGLVRKAKQALFKMTKDLFDKAEIYFTDNLLDFFELGKEEKTYPYNELIMDNFTIQRVVYDLDVLNATEIEMSVGNYMTREEIESGAMSKEDLSKYFKKWVARQDLLHLPDVTAAWTS